LRANNIQDEGLNFDDLVYVDKKKVSSEQLLRKGDILVCSSSGSKNLVGKAAVVNEDLPIAFGAFCKVIRVLTMDAAFVGQYFRSPRYRREISAASAGANINNIRNEHIDDMLLPVYSKAEQVGMAQKLSCVDTLIDQRRGQLAMMEQLVKSRFIEMFGTIDNNSHGFKIVTLVDASSDFFAGGDKPDDCVLTPDENHPFPVYANGYENAGLQGFSGNCRVEKEAVTVSARGTIGYCFIRKANFTPIVRLITIVPRDDVSVVYLKYAIDMMKIQSSGTSQAQLTVPDFKRERIIVPPIELQEQFAAFVEQVDKSKYQRVFTYGMEVAA